MVVDAGGGTIDITVHRNQSDGGLVELHSPTGGAWGSSCINKKFEELIEELVGKDNMAEVKNSPFYLDTMVTFEVRQRSSLFLIYFILFYFILFHDMLCYVMLCYVMLCYVMLCYVMLCYVPLFF